MKKTIDCSCTRSRLGVEGQFPLRCSIRPYEKQVGPKVEAAIAAMLPSAGQVLGVTFTPEAIDRAARIPPKPGPFSITFTDDPSDSPPTSVPTPDRILGVAFTPDARDALPTLITQTLITPAAKTAEGILIQSITIPLEKISEIIINDPSAVYQIDPRKWEEIIAGSYKVAGFDEVILTPRSGDHGRDVIAVKHGFGSVRFIESVKRYTPGSFVKADDVRALGHVLQADHNATKGIVSTTWEFAPKIREDPFIKPYLPYRIELLNGTALIQRFRDWIKHGK
jgi:restriction system protein